LKECNIEYGYCKEELKRAKQDRVELERKLEVVEVVLHPYFTGA
jgi:hypothetical protein